MQLNWFAALLIVFKWKHLLYLVVRINYFKQTNIMYCTLAYYLHIIPATFLVNL